jgi:hypothetical protein
VKCPRFFDNYPGDELSQNRTFFAVTALFALYEATTHHQKCARPTEFQYLHSLHLRSLDHRGPIL